MLPQRERDFGARRTSSQLLEAFFPHVGSVAALAARAEGYALSGSCFAQVRSQRVDVGGVEMRHGVRVA